MRNLITWYKVAFFFEAKVKLNHSIVFKWSNFGEQCNPSLPPPPRLAFKVAGLIVFYR